MTIVQDNICGLISQAIYVQSLRGNHLVAKRLSQLIVKVLTNENWDNLEMAKELDEYWNEGSAKYQLNNARYELQCLQTELTKLIEERNPTNQKSINLLFQHRNMLTSQIEAAEKLMYQFAM